LCGRNLSELIQPLVIRATLDVELMLSRIFVDFLQHEVPISVLVRVIQELNPLQDLETVYRGLLELVDADDVLRWLIVEADMSTLSIHLSSVLRAVY